jgi:tetratricopeptide (TPR) repeat protein
VCQKNPSPVHPSYTLRSICDAVRKNKPQRSSTSAAQEKSSGNECYSRSQFAEAIQHYTHALELSPRDQLENATLHNNRAQCFIKLEQYYRALDDLNEALRLSPGDVKALIRKGLCLSHLGDYKGSREAYQRALSLDTSGKFRAAILEGLQKLPVDNPDHSSSSHQPHPQTQHTHQNQYFQPPPQYAQPFPQQFTNFFPPQGQGQSQSQAQAQSFASFQYPGQYGSSASYQYPPNFMPPPNFPHVNVNVNQPQQHHQPPPQAQQSSRDEDRRRNRRSKECNIQ